MSKKKLIWIFVLLLLVLGGCAKLEGIGKNLGDSAGSRWDSMKSSIDASIFAHPVVFLMNSFIIWFIIFVVYQLWFQKKQGDTSSEIVYLIASIPAALLAAGKFFGGVAAWQHPITKNLFHLPVIVNFLLVAFGVYFIANLIWGDKMKEDNRQVKGAVWVVAIVIGFLVATGPFTDFMKEESKATGVKVKWENVKWEKIEGTYYYLWEKPTFVKLWALLRGSNLPEREPQGWYTESELNKYVNELEKGNKDAVLGSADTSKTESRVYPILKFPRIWSFIAALIVFSILFLKFVKISEAMEGKQKWLDWGVAALLAGQLVHRTDTTLGMIVSGGQVLLIVILYRQFSEKSTGFWGRVFWAVIAAGLIVWIGHTVLAPYDVASGGWLGGGGESPELSEVKAQIKSQISDGTLKDIEVNKIYEVTVKEIKYDVKVISLEKYSGGKIKEIELEVKKERITITFDDEGSVKAVEESGTYLGFIPKSVAHTTLFIAIGLLVLFGGILSAYKAKTPTGKMLNFMARNAGVRLKNAAAAVGNVATSWVPFTQNMRFSYSTAKGTMESSFGRNRIIIYAMFNYLKRLEIFFGKKAQVDEIGNRYYSRGNFQDIKVVDHEGRLVDIKTATVGQWSDFEDVKKNLRVYRSGTYIDRKEVNEIVKSNIDKIKDNKYDDCITALNRTFEGKIKALDLKENSNEKGDAAFIKLMKEELDKVNAITENDAAINEATAIFYALLERNKKQKGWCSYSYELLEYARILRQLMGDLPATTTENEEAVQQKITQISSLKRNIDAITGNIRTAKENYDRYFAAYCAHNYLRAINLEVLDQYNAGSHTFRFARKGAKLTDKKEITSGGQDDIGGSRGIEVDKYGRVFGNPEKQLSNPSEIDLCTRMENLGTWMTQDWEVFLKDLRTGYYHQNSRAAKDYVEKMRKRRDFADRLVTKVYTIAPEENPAFDMHALEDPGNWTPGSSKRENYYDAADKVPTDKTREPALSTRGIAEYMMWKLNFDISNEEKKRRFASMLPAENKGSKSPSDIVTTLNEVKE